MAESRTGNEGYVCVSVFERATMGSKVERKKGVLPKHPLTEIIALLHIGSAGYYTVVAPAGAF